jgi:hypothetical protein
LIAQFEWHDESMAIDNGRTQPQQQSPVLPIPRDALRRRDRPNAEGVC